MVIKRIIKIIAYIEILIGLSTILGLATSPLFFVPTKPLNVFVFVMISAVVSGILGIGILKYKEQARILIVFFSGYVVLTKILVFSNLLQLYCDRVTFIPSYFKNSISIFYHVFIILFFTRQNVKKYFIHRIPHRINLSPFWRRSFYQTRCCINGNMDRR